MRKGVKEQLEQEKNFTVEKDYKCLLSQLREQSNERKNRGYYGIFLKKEMDQIKTTSSTGKKVEKRMIDTNELLGTWETIAKAAEAEQICAAKMSRSIKLRTIFQDDYYFCNTIQK